MKTGWKIFAILLFLLIMISASFVLAVGECSDGIDNDNDGVIDFEEDLGCFATENSAEKVSGKIPLGVNLGESNYYSREWFYTDWMRTASRGQYSDKFNSESISEDLVPRDEKGYPLELPFVHEGKNYTPWFLFMRAGDGTFPDGRFVVLYDGEGKLGFGFNAKIISEEDGRYVINVTHGNPDSGFFMRIEESKKGNHVKNIRIIEEKYEGIYQENLVHPVFIERLGNSSVLRFMNAMVANSPNIVKWEDRNIPNYITPEKMIIKKSEISNIKQIPDTKFSGRWPVEIKTRSPHNLVTGQIVTFSGTDAYLKHKDDDTGVIATSKLEDETRMIEVVDSHTFRTDIFSPGWKRYRLEGNPYNDSLIEFKEGSNGNLTMLIRSGIAVEDIAEISNDANIDSWVTIPHLVDDNYIRNFARVLNEKLDSDRKVYVEYSNEVWNTAGPFRQTQYAEAMGRHEGIGIHAFKAKRSAEIFKIFEEEFGDGRVINVVAGQAANPWIAEQYFKALENSSYNPSGVGPEAYAIAPYFGYNLADLIEEGDFERLSVSQILDLVIEEADERTARMTRMNREVADEYDVSLFAYEGGQHLVIPGNLEWSDNEKFESYLNKLYEINRHDKMKTAYDMYFVAWYENGGGLFLQYTYVGFQSKHGSWGMLEYQNQPIDEAPKYAAYLQAMKQLGGDANISDIPSGNQNPGNKTTTPNQNTTNQNNTGENNTGGNSGSSVVSSGSSHIILGDQGEILDISKSVRTNFIDTSERELLTPVENQQKDIDFSFNFILIIGISVLLFLIVIVLFIKFW